MKETLKEDEYKIHQCIFSGIYYYNKGTNKLIKTH